MKSEEKNPVGSLISFLSVTVIISASFITCKFTSLWVHRFPNSGKGRSVSVHPWAPPHTHSITLRVGNLIAEVFLLSLNLHSCCKTDVPERECGLLISYTEADGTQRETDSLGPDFLCINKFPQAPVAIWHHSYGIVVILKSLGRLHIQHDTQYPHRVPQQAPHARQAARGILHIECVY